MAKTTTKLNAQDRVIPFCAATGIDHVAVGILARERGVCAHGQRTRGAHGDP
jgi:hypothetical protein